jgi:hypothetical protein
MTWRAAQNRQTFKPGRIPRDSKSSVLPSTTGKRGRIRHREGPWASMASRSTATSRGSWVGLLQGKECERFMRGGQIQMTLSVHGHAQRGTPARLSGPQPMDLNRLRILGRADRSSCGGIVQEGPQAELWQAGTCPGVCAQPLPVC